MVCQLQLRARASMGCAGAAELAQRGGDEHRAQRTHGNECEVHQCGMRVVDVGRPGVKAVPTCDTSPKSQYQGHSIFPKNPEPRAAPGHHHPPAQSPAAPGTRAASTLPPGIAAWPRQTGPAPATRHRTASPSAIRTQNSMQRFAEHGKSTVQTCLIRCSCTGHRLYIVWLLEWTSRPCSQQGMSVQQGVQWLAVHRGGSSTGHHTS